MNKVHLYIYIYIYIFTSIEPCSNDVELPMMKSKEKTSFTHIMDFIK